MQSSAPRYQKGFLFCLSLFLGALLLWIVYSIATFSFLRHSLHFFDPETTEFVLHFSSCQESGEKIQDQLTPEQRQLAARYLRSLRFKKARLTNPLEGVAGGSSFFIAYETPCGKLFAGCFAHMNTKNEITLYAEYEHDDSLYKQLKEIVLDTNTSQ